MQIIPLTIKHTTYSENSPVIDRKGNLSRKGHSVKITAVLDTAPDDLLMTSLVGCVCTDIDCNGKLYIEKGIQWKLQGFLTLLQTIL